MHKNRFFHLIRIMPIALVVLVLTTAGVLANNFRNFPSESSGFIVYQGGLSSVDLIYAFLEGEEYLMETEDEKSQQDSALKFFKESQHFLFGVVDGIPNPINQPSFFDQPVNIAQLRLYQAYCQLKIDC